MKLAILMFCPQFRPLIGGAERQAEKLALALVAMGCRVTILTPQLDLNSPNIEKVNGLTIRRFELVDLSRRYPVPGVSILSIPHTLWQIVRAARPLLKEVNILHCHVASLYTAGAALAGRLSRVPVVCKVATGDERSDLGKLESSCASGPLMAWLVRLLVTVWIATTSSVREALIRAGVTPQRIRHIPNGVELPDLQERPIPNQLVRRFLYLGRVSTKSQRDIPTLLKAFDQLCKAHPQIELAIVGGGDLLEDTKQLAGTYAGRDRIHFPGFDRPEKWLAWAECLVLPSRREGLSNALLEAMAAGLPCIANDIPPNREVLEEGAAGILVPIGDANALAQAMCRLATIPCECASWAKRGRKRTEEVYGMSRITDRYLELYTSLVEIPSSTGQITQD